MPEEPSETSTTRRDLRAMLGDGAAFSVMQGIGENYLPAFALALGMGEVVSGLIACVPLLCGAGLQLASPVGVRRFGSYRRWVVLCAALQAASFLPLAAGAIAGWLPVWLLFLVAGSYWGAGMATGPAWSTWAPTIVPLRIRSHFFARRTRVSQFGVLFGFIGGGMALQLGQHYEHTLSAFAWIFLVAGACRFISSRLLSLQSEAVQPGAEMQVIGPRELLSRLQNHDEGRLLWYLWLVYAMAQISGPYFTPFLLGQLRTSYAEYMLVLATSILAKTLAMPWLGRFAHRHGSRKLMILGGITIIPLPVLWVFSNSLPYLMCVQLCAGAAWGALELSIVLMSFDCIPASHRTSMLTLYNVGYAVASVAGSLLGGFILKLNGETQIAYLIVFAASSAARLLTLPLMMRLPSPGGHFTSPDEGAETTAVSVQTVAVTSIPKSIARPEAAIAP